MRIAVCIKQVPDPQAPAGTFYVDESANEPRWSPPAQSVISTFDLHALEAAAQIKDQHAAHVTVICIGEPDVEIALRRALAAGADQAVRVEAAVAPEGDRLAVARALAAVIRKLGGIELILCGRIAADWDMGHVPMMLAEFLGMYGATPIKAIHPSEGMVVVERLTDEGYETLEMALPCVLAVSNELNEPRYPTMRAVLDAQRKSVVTWSLSDLGLDAPDERNVRLQHLYGRDLTRACEFVDAPSQEEGGELLAELLKEKALV